ncbi:dimethylarginine dimethylaminohydrolase family protein [Sphingobacterium sp. BIGb0165]|uniref:dimethylarginine dimethylaminohydrolase family protein n=1 Tax=Sphingobacterium sp. BIGb0165 TaxID=2940615 RepID=UPI00216A8378|nr:arginine deiminase family protein [Sphingobacterium sp. BIGb0165]MCS4227314.1 N-dimethylarginine dimethylaminohydrolase [Sphingobacterium sp. BIGb0165]
MVYVENEFAPLQKVILAVSEFGFPKAVRAEDLRFLPDTDTESDVANAGKDFAEMYPGQQKAWDLERANFATVLEKYGVEVLRPRQLTSLEKEVGAEDGYANFFVRDPFFTVGHAVIEGSLRFLQRRNEVLPMRDIFEQQVYPDDCLYVAAPQPAINDHGDLSRWHGPFIEGGDVLVLGKQVFVGSSGLASNSLGIRWLSKLLKPYGYQVEEIRLHPDILHLDCALGLIREGLMVVCEDAFLDGIPEHLKQWDKINVTLTEAGQLATNGLSINPNVYVTDPVFKPIGDKLSLYGIHVEYVDFKISRSFGGSFRCSTQPLLRRF